ncbi:hypothetical protein M3O96_20680 [Aquiflexum sp. TKW24L]|nr:hypothetical protein [Aquiflexum sp. TKW24L]MCL6261528.1 hypothetical protein [Aquiflexum sp. TKW24L]
MRFIASNPILFSKRDGRPKPEDRITGHFSLQPRFNRDNYFTGIIADI